MMALPTSDFQELVQAVRDVPSYVDAPVFTFLGGVIGVFVGPPIKWSIEKKREVRQHRRTLIVSWYSMISDVSNNINCSQEIGKPLSESQVRGLLEMHRAYGSFFTASRNYNGAGIRGIKLRFSLSPFGRKLSAMNLFRRKRYFIGEGRLVRSGTNLPEVLRRTMEEISKIEKWWGID
jgi:hypothetical protein